MFAKLISEAQIEIAPRCIYTEGQTYTNPTEEQYLEAGYYEVIKQDKPETKKWYDLVVNYKLENNKIIQDWNYIKQLKPDYGRLIVGYIRENYSLNDELAIQRQRNNSSEKEEEFNQYNVYCDSCKQKAKADLADWEKA